jgi:hypothetical protein
MVTAVTPAAKGTVGITLSGAPISYRYNEEVFANRHHTDMFNYTLTDAFGLSSAGTINVVIDVETYE